MSHRIAATSRIAGLLLAVAATPILAQSNAPAVPKDKPSLTAPATPKHGGRPGPGDPGIGEIMRLVALPDLALVDAFRLADTDIPWGTSAVVTADAAASKQRGQCLFRYRYTTRNEGAGASAATTNRIFRDAQNGPQLATAALPALVKDAQAVSSGHVALKPGTWTLYIHADATKTVPESDEADNLRRVRVTVKGDCG